jgi:SAM-dependent methyltransferase
MDAPDIAEALAAACYRADASRLPDRLAARLVELSADDETREFVAHALRGRHGRARAWLHAILRRVLSDFDVNGLLGTYPLFLLGTEQARRLLGPGAHGRLLDVGAGSGDVTLELAPLFSEVVVTETSFVMARRLERRGFRCVRADLSQDDPPAGPWDVVSCLNVIDRCARPRTLLARLCALAGERTRLLLATPLPYQPFVYAGGHTRPPLEQLAISASSWEACASELVDHVLEPLGLSVEALARVPYLSGGDPDRPLYILDDAVLVCRVVRPTRP